MNEDVLQIRYCLDGKENATIPGNTTLSVPNGLHDVRVYAIDKVGRIGASETVNFKVDVPDSALQLESFPAESVAAVSGISAVVVAVAVLVYLKIRKR